MAYILCSIKFIQNVIMTYQPSRLTCTLNDDRILLLRAPQSTKILKVSSCLLDTLNKNYNSSLISELLWPVKCMLMLGCSFKGCKGDYITQLYTKLFQHIIISFCNLAFVGELKFFSFHFSFLFPNLKIAFCLVSMNIS